MKKVTEMTTEEFKEELARIRAKALEIKPMASGEGRFRNRTYSTQKRGDFYGGTSKLWRS